MGRTLPRPGGETVPGKERRPHKRSAIIALYSSLCKSLWKSNRERQRGAGHTKRTACQGWPRCQLPAGAVRPPAHTPCPGRVPASSCPALPGWPARTLLGPCAHLLAPVQSSACSPAHTLPGRPAHLLTPCSGRMTTCSHPARVACLPPRALPGPRARLLASCRGGLLTSSRPAGAVRPPPRTLPGPCARLLAPCSGRLLTCSHPARVACPGCAPARAARPPAHLLAPCPGGLLASSRPTHLLAPVQSLACTPHFCQTARKGLGNAMPSQVLTSLPGTRAGGLPLSPLTRGRAGWLSLGLRGRTSGPGCLGASPAGPLAVFAVASCQDSST